MHLPLRLLAMLTAALLFLTAAHPALATPPSADLMKRLAVHAASFEKMKTHASYALDGRMETLDSDAVVDSEKIMTGNIIAVGKKAHLDVTKYTEDGTDKTQEAQDKARDAAKKKRDKKKNIRMPFHADEQARYDFDQIETDKLDRSRVRISFVPKIKTESTIEGSAWVDTKTGTVVSAGFKVSQPPAFVDYVHITVEFGAATALGPAVSKVTLTGKGGFFFLRKNFRADATLSKYTIVP
ncbi:MAG: hypothetical protein ABI461_21710 [Polyangiaceae bacterium]